VAVGVGVFMDADHLYDCYQRYIKGNLTKTYLLLHAWEYSIAGLGVLLNQSEGGIYISVGRRLCGGAYHQCVGSGL